MDEVTVGDPDFLDDAALEVLNGFSARLGFDRSEGDRGALERRDRRPGAETEDKAADQEISGPGQATKAVAKRRFLYWRAPPIFEAHAGHDGKAAPLVEERSGVLGTYHGVIGHGEAPALPGHYGSCCCCAGSREPSCGRTRYL